MPIRFLAGLLLVLLFASCGKEKPIAPAPGTIENQTFNTTVLIDGHDYDNTIIRNCIFENIVGDGLQIRDVDGLCVENCIFRNISEDAIRFRNSGSSNAVKIKDNEIYNIQENGILAPEGHLNSLIEGNLIYNVALSNTSSQFGAPHHGIYFQGIGVSILNNEIYNVLNDQGNAISIRTSGIIAGNKLHQATDHGISYYSDHPSNSGVLLIENNFIYDNGKRAINLASNGNTANHIAAAEIRFNTMISSTSSVIGINDKLTGTAVDLTANIAIRMDGSSLFVFSNQPYTTNRNITANNDVGFVSYAGRDLHLTNSSIARNHAAGITNFPAIDIDGDNRASATLDAGADEIP